MDNPTLPYPEDCIERKTLFGTIYNEKEICTVDINEQYRMAEKYHVLLKNLKDKNPEKVHIFETMDYYCTSKECSILKENKLLYGFTDHISIPTSFIVGKGLNDFVNQI